MTNIQLSSLVNMYSPQDVLVEVEVILKSIDSHYDLTPLRTSFQTFLDLYEGRYPGYQACNTYYHDITHSTDSLLAMARLIHGSVLDGEVFTQHDINLSLTATLFHDCGYIQTVDDTEGTGAKYTQSHVTRSADFLVAHYGDKLGASQADIDAYRFMILCTDLAVDLFKISFPSSRIELLGKMLGAADLLAQMADRTYLEKLLYLYHEFRESKSDGPYTGEVDLLRKTVGFYDYVGSRLAPMDPMFDRFIRLHFASRWNVEQNLYEVAIQRQKDYLVHILSIPNTDPRDHLRRGDIVKKVRQLYGSGF